MTRPTHSPGTAHRRCFVFLVACLAVVAGTPAVAGAEASAAALEPGGPPTMRQLLLHALSDREALEATVGKHRRRELAELRFRVRRCEFWPLHSFGEDRAEREWMADAALRSFSKVVRESVLAAGPWGRWQRAMEARGDRWAEARGPAGLDVSPKVGVGGKRYFGVELGLPLRSAAAGQDAGALALEARHGLDTDRHRVRMRWTTRRGELVVDHRFGNGRDGSETAVGFRIGR